MKPWEIYTLSDPREGNVVQYVGVTRYGKRRLRSHIHDAIRGLKWPRCEWIRGLLAVGLKPVFAVIDSGNGDSWESAERSWIAYYRSIGQADKNCLPGGQGMPGLTISPEHRHKLSRAQTGRIFTASHRANISAAAKLRGMPPMTAERKAKLSATLKGRSRPQHSPESHQAQARAITGRRLSPETREKMRLAQRQRRAQECGLHG